MKISYFIISTLTAGWLLGACGKSVQTKDVLQNIAFSSRSIPADGNTLDTITIIINPDASIDRRNIIITTSAGALTGAKNDSLTITAIFSGTKLVATAVLKAPSSAGTIIITAQSQSLSPNGDYMLKDSLTATKVPATSIGLQASSFGIGSNFITTDTLTGIIKAGLGKKASSGVKVLFEDFLQGWRTASGRFDSPQVSSDMNSTVTSIYGAPLLPVGTNIMIVATILDSANNKSNMADTVTITINQ